MKDYIITQEEVGIRVDLKKEIATTFITSLTQDFIAVFDRDSLSKKEAEYIIYKNQDIIVDYIFFNTLSKDYFKFLLKYDYIKLYFDEYIWRDIDAIGPYIPPEDIDMQRYYDFLWDLYIALGKIK